MRTILATLMLTAVPLTLAHADDPAVRAPVDAYIRGHATGDGSHWRAAFYPSARIVGYRDGQLRELTVDQFVALAPGHPASDEAQRRRTIERIDVAGTVALAKVVLDYPTVRFTDYLSLMKIDGQWRIVNKIFHAEPKAQLR
jgi:hypothetical protein